MEKVKKIDLHAHAVPWGDFTPPYKKGGGRKLTVKELFSEYYEKLGVEKCTLLPIVSPEGVMEPVTSEMVKFIADENSDRAFWFCGVDPRAISGKASANLGYLLEHYKSLGAKGVGEVTANLFADDPRMENLFSACAALNLPVTIHIAKDTLGGYGLIDEIHLPRIEKMLKKYPDLRILGHSQPFWNEIGGNVTEENRGKYVKGKVENGHLIRLLRENENLLCDLSAGSGANALMRDREHAARFIEEFSDRIYYGCDICMSGSQFPFELDAFLTSMLENGEISRENYYKICRGNAEKLLGI
ncbi:MAG: amidohydrolase family protein [Clostridia bacterium]|nr:amidohydrolase family protein [Clostridia bacterium]